MKKLQKFFENYGTFLRIGSLIYREQKTLKRRVVRENKKH